MAEQKELGKINFAEFEFGFGGYQEAMFGASFNFSFGGWGGSDFISGSWSNSTTVSEYTKWTEEDRSKARVEMCNRIEEIMVDAKVDKFSALVGKPVEVTIKDGSIKSWRILKEVL